MITVKNGLLLINNNLEKRDLYLEDGKIKDICENLEVKGELIDAEGCFIMNGAIDAHVHLRQPGFEYKETIESGTMAAAKGGVTTCLAMPNLKPCPDSLENLAIEQEIIDREAKVNVLPYSALTVGQKSLELVDFESLKGKVVAFTDDGFGVNNIPLLRKAMEIAKK